MKYEKLGKGRATINDKGYELEVIIPAKKNLFATLFMCAWLGGWAVGYVMVVTNLFPSVAKESLGISAFIIFWLIGWTIGGGAVIAFVAWNLFGKEVITLSSDTLKIERRLLNLSRPKRYSLSNIKNLRVISSGAGQSFFGWSNRDYWGVYGNLAFNYGMKTVKFARGIDEAEASHILSLFKRMLPQQES